MTLSNPFTRLEPDTQVPYFDCGDQDLNEFFAKDASAWQKELLAVTYYLQLDDRVALYFSLSNDKITAKTLPKNLWRKVKSKFPHEKHRNDYPAVKIGRFAVANDFRCRPEHWGTKALDFIKEWMVTENKTGCCFITVDAYPGAVTFYQKNGFKFLGSQEEQRYMDYVTESNYKGTIAMYFSLKTIIE
ncbi:MAG: GNAT family N-acetyltransferase [Barnesiella sp.]|nr:GNAT family N-acetyltransferase [Bacteroidales bacterium]MBD5243024.1 GNAT family N-acetyltransferase [Barnesiella sp.]